MIIPPDEGLASARGVVEEEEDMGDDGRGCGGSVYAVGGSWCGTVVVWWGVVWWGVVWLVWCGEVWWGVVWLVWCGVVWCGVVW